MVLVVQHKSHTALICPVGLDLERKKKSILKTSHSQHGRETLHQLPPLRLVSGRAAHAHYALPKYSKHTELQMQIEADTDCMHSWVQEYLRKDMILFDFFASVRQHSGCEI